MGLMNLKSVLDPALKRGYAVGSFNVINSAFADAILDAGERKSAPLILSVAEAHLKYMKLEQTAAYLTHLAASSSLPIVVHLDHGCSLEAIERAIESEFTSVMFDGSSLLFHENVERTRKVVERCHPLEISVEAELGAVGGGEADGLGGQADPDLFTNPELVQEFVSETGIDALAIAIGNVHGRYRGEPELDFERLEDIRQRARIPLVLHGGSGISAADFRRAIGLGISKVNVFTSMAEAGAQTTKAILDGAGDRLPDYPELLEKVRLSISSVVEEHIEIFGGTGMAFDGNVS